MEDVAAPYQDGVECGCSTSGPDGSLDLTIKFNNQEAATLLAGHGVGEEGSLAITGRLKEEFGGTPVWGEDCVVIVH